MELSSRKYLSTALKWLVPFVLLETLICLLLFTKTIETGIFAVVNTANFVCLLLPSMYFLIMFFIFKNKCKEIVPADGVITNWKQGFYRYTGGVIIKLNDNEYSTSAYFSTEEAKDMVGKTVSYAIIADTLFIYEIKD